MRATTIKSSWFAFSPGHRMDARFWIEVDQAMEELGIDKDTAGESEVKRAIERVKEKVAEDKAAGRPPRVDYL